MNPEFENDPKATLCLTVEEGLIPKFFVLLSQGFTVKVRVGCTMRELLHRQLGLSADYIEQRVQTIFLDGKAVDNIDTTVVRHGSTLALSAAMPGLAGATLRRDGAYAAMRSQISHKNNTVDDSAENGTVMLKLFNLVALELGPMFLKQGIWIDGKNLENFFQRVPDFFWDGCLTAEIDGTSQDVREISLIKWWHKQVFFKLK